MSGTALHNGTRAIAILCIAVGSVTAATGASFTIIDVRGSSTTNVNSINDHGWVTGNERTHTGHYQGYVRAADGTITTFKLGDTAYPMSINSAGATTGYYYNGFDFRGYERNAKGTIYYNGLEAVRPQSINKYRQLTGVYYSNGAHGFVGTAKHGVIMFDVQGSEDTYAYNINDAGSITGYYAVSSGAYHGFVRAADGTITSFDVPGTTRTTPFAINGNGAVAGSYVNGGITSGFVRSSSGEITTFDPAGSVNTQPTGINDKGVIAGWYYDGTNIHGFVRHTGGTITSFDAPRSGTLAAQPYSINNDGAVAGSFADSKGSHGFIRTP
jgi:hypothetical protein